MNEFNFQPLSFGKLQGDHQYNQQNLTNRIDNVGEQFRQIGSAWDGWQDLRKKVYDAQQSQIRLNDFKNSVKDFNFGKYGKAAEVAFNGMMNSGDEQSAWNWAQSLQNIVNTWENTQSLREYENAQRKAAQDYQQRLENEKYDAEQQAKNIAIDSKINYRGVPNRPMMKRTNEKDLMYSDLASMVSTLPRETLVSIMNDENNEGRYRNLAISELARRAKKGYVPGSHYFVDDNDEYNRLKSYKNNYENSTGRSINWTPEHKQILMNRVLEDYRKRMGDKEEGFNIGKSYVDGLSKSDFAKKDEDGFSNYENIFAQLNNEYNRIYNKAYYGGFLNNAEVQRALAELDAQMLAINQRAAKYRLAQVQKEKANSSVDFSTWNGR